VISAVAYERRLDDAKQRVGATLDLEFKDDLGVPKLLQAVESVAGVKRLHLRARA
jgi:hypothetical protein